MSDDSYASGQGGSGRVTIYDVARAAGVAASTVSRALSQPGRVSYETAERVRAAAASTGYRSATIRRQPPPTRTSLLAMVVADIGNPVFIGMIRGAERTAAHAGYTLMIIETQESEQAERDALTRVLPAADGTILTSSRMTDGAIRDVAKQKPLVVLNRTVSQVPSVTSDNVRAVKRASEHLAAAGIESISYLAGPEASWADGMRWRGLREASLELDLRVHRLGPHLPTLQGGAAAAQAWLRRPTPGVIAYNDLVAIGFLRAVVTAGCRVPEDVSVIGFDNIVDSELVTPSLTTIAAPLVSLGSAAVNHLLKRAWRGGIQDLEPMQLPARLVVRGSTRHG
ncbi:LacI family DNA-binding transcriptional regulator [uncultured Friedmanniella sp.]|uniref:LacI family DNA-binding transcriptional regulator n=1 Tax=uncultured Friedmanniella sp. TaxID=335381 RepID=UPI0035CBE11F